MKVYFFNSNNIISCDSEILKAFWREGGIRVLWYIVNHVGVGEVELFNILFWNMCGKQRTNSSQFKLMGKTPPKCLGCVTSNMLGLYVTLS